MSNKFVISLSAISAGNISYRFFKDKADKLLFSTLDEWVADPMRIIDMKLPELKEYTFYFNRLHNFRKRMAASLKQHYIYESSLQEDETTKYMLIFDVDAIMNDLYKDKLQYNSNKVHDLTLIVSELTVKFKANNYIDNMNFLFSNNCDKLSQELIAWNDIVRNMKSETFYLVDDFE